MHENLLRYRGYFARPEYSADDGLFYGRILGIQDMVDFSAEGEGGVVGAFHQAVDDYLAFCLEIGKSPQK